MRERRPYVTIKVAISEDGKISEGAGVRTRLTGAAADRLIHRDRAEMDALAVGSGTMLSDDPLLTPRGAYRYRPLTRVDFRHAAAHSGCGETVLDARVQGQ